MEDKVTRCVEIDCRKEFTITAGEQEFFASRKDENTGKSFSLPKRCPDCRAKRKAQKDIQAQSPFNEVKNALKEKHHDRIHGGR